MTKAHQLKARGSRYAGQKAKAEASHPEKTNGCPAAPTWLCEAAQALWDEHADTLYELGCLGILDVISCGMLFEAMAEHQQHRAAVEKEGAVIERQHYCGPHPEAKLRDDAAKRVTTLMKQCGLTRAGRQSMTLDEKPKDPNDPRVKNAWVFNDNRDPESLFAKG